MQLPAGTYVVTASGGVIDTPIVVSDVTLGSENVKVDFDTSEIVPFAADIVGFNTIDQFWAANQTDRPSIQLTTERGQHQPEQKSLALVISTVMVWTTLLGEIHQV